MPHQLKYDWKSIQSYYDEGHTATETQNKFGFSNTALTKAKQKGRFKSRSKSFFGGGATVSVIGKYSDKTRQGEVAAAFLDLWGANRGWIVSKPNVECSYDRVVDECCNGTMQRIQLKYTENSTSDKLVAHTQKHKGGKKVPYQNGEIDFIVVYDAKTQALYKLPPNTWAGKVTVTLRHTKPKNNQEKGILYADDYRLY